MKIAIFGNNYKTENLSLLEPLFQLFEQRKIEVLVERKFYEFIIEKTQSSPHIASFIENDNFLADIAISIGGDGTFLRTASVIGKKEIPIIGINTGRLGFLADITCNDIVEPFSKILDGEYFIEERSVLRLECGDEKKFDGVQIALNEVALLKQDSSSMITIQTRINNEWLTDYQADGLIIATPTGSTAYSLSVGGPIVVPQAKNIILTPVASHSLTVRPLIITDDCEIKLKVLSRTGTFLASIDGRSDWFDNSVDFTIKKADFCIKVIKQNESSFFSTLKNKMMWGVDKRPIIQ